MRRIAPFLPIAIALATLAVGAIQAAVKEPTEWAFNWIGLLPALIVFVGPIPYLIPILLLEWAKSVRRRSAAPPVVGRGATLLALPAITVAALWPLVTGLALLLHRTLVAHALLVDHRLACAAVWAVSVAVTATWDLAAACRWIRWARPVAVMGAGPYR